MASPGGIAGPSSTPAVAGSSSAAAAGQKPDRLYVGNLAPNVDEHTLIHVFSKFGQIVKLDYMFHKTGPLKGKPRGFAFIEFKSKDDALKAMVKLHDRLLRGRKLVVTSANSAPHTDPASSGIYRRQTDTKTTTLSLLKNQQKRRGPQTPEQQIAAMEAKLAAMARNRPPGASPGLVPMASPGGSASASPVPGSPTADAEADEALGVERGRAEAQALEDEMRAAAPKSPPRIPGLPRKPSFL